MGNAHATTGVMNILSEALHKIIIFILNVHPVRARQMPSVTETAAIHIIRELKKNFGIDPTNSYNIGVAGQSGTGKSTLINAILGLKSDQDGAASTGVVETTLTMKPYTHPVYKHITFWDVPGSGTEKVPDENYFQSQGLIVFDCLIIMLNSRLLESDLKLALTAIENSVPVVFVRSKSDRYINDLISDKGITLDTAVKIIRETQESLRNQISEYCTKDCPLFVLSSRVLLDMMVNSTQRKTKHVVLDEGIFLETIIQSAYSARTGTTEHTTEEDPQLIALEPTTSTAADNGPCHVHPTVIGAETAVTIDDVFPG